MPFRYILFFYHLIFSLIFYAFIVEKGGDAHAYWILEADTSQGAESWGQYWGFGTFFIQCLNYVPSSLLGLPFWAGNLLYGLASAWAWVALYQKVNENLGEQTSPYFLIIWLLPNMHFWSSGVGKESLIWIFLVVFLIHLDFKKPQVILSFLGLGLMFLIRPVYALILSPILLFQWIKDSPFSRLYTWIGMLALLGFSYLVMDQILKATHIEKLDFQHVLSYIDYQMGFLKVFQPASYVPMQDYSFPYAYFTAFFRPFPWDGAGWLYLLAGLENLLALLLISAAFIMGIWKKSWSHHRLLYQGTFFLLLLILLASISLNNFGIIMRYKAPGMIFVYLWSGLTVFSGLKLILAKQINKK